MFEVACTEWLKVFRWMDGQSDWSEPRHVKHGLKILQQYGVQGGNRILNRYSDVWRSQRKPGGVRL